MLHAECVEFQEKKAAMYEQLQDLEKNRESFERADDLKTFFNLIASMQSNLLNLDRQLQQKRKMLFDIEKENIMTIASSLRSVPKKTDKKKNPLLEALADG